MLYDLEKINKIDKFKYDVILVGAGASGLICAKELSNKKPNIRIAIIESGGLRKNKKINSLDSNISTNKSINFKDSVARYYGGKTNLWAGRILGIGEEELQSWPIDKQELLFWRDAAMKHLINDYSIDDLYDNSIELAKKTYLGTLLDSGFQICPSILLRPKVFRINYGKYSNIDLFINSTVVKLNKAKSQDKIISLFACSSITGRKFKFKANQYICCNGGIEVVRLLFLSSKNKSIGLANKSGNIGRNFSGHPRGVEGIIKLNKKINFDSNFIVNPINHKKDFKLEFGLELDTDFCSKNKISKSRICFNPLIIELHSKFFYFINKGYINKRKKINNLGIKEFNFMMGFFFYVQLKLKKLFKLPRETAYLIVSNYGASSLNKNSKVYLGKDKDYLGYEKAIIDWQISKKDKESLKLTHKNLSEVLKKRNLGVLQSKLLETKEKWNIWGGSSHFMSTTVMSKSPNHGVVDINCKAHDLKNLYIVGPSIFPTPYFSNPILFIILFSLRLANHITKLYK
tara:strand:+ start:6469 stop:8016 length:1548 start_codon:yes stop_codon:yes gene_type:complete